MSLPLPITGVGLVTSVGYGVVGSCAALRAGVSLPRELEMEVGEDGGDAAALATGFPVWPYTDGFFQTGAWVRLGVGALQDLSHRAGGGDGRSPDLWPVTSLVGALPAINSERFHWTLEELPDAPLSFFLEPLARQGAPGALDSSGWDARGHVSLAAGILRADRGLASRQAERFAIVAADSYLDPFTLRALHQARRLKAPDRATGLMPGEAGAAVLVESDRSARRRNAEILGQVDAVAMGTAPREKRGSARPAAPLLGRALAKAASDVLRPAGQGTRFQGDIFLDLNGEDWKANAWGHAQVLLSRLVDLDRCRTFVPAESLGETGAASAPIGVALALYNFMVDGAERALVLSMADDGAVSAIRLSRASRPRR
ncbi:MAG TPA: hypothetical protein VND93_16115 [Myxococcales bacterium]|jgi:3-oxoacyl-[acyl-carrier-protein] synthase-1|nr:hypothetical protein [Myxococcales bacterium]